MDPDVSTRLSLEALSRWLCAFQAVFRAHGHACVRVGGSGARALLDGRLAGLRDVDLFLDGADHEAPGAALATMAAALVRAGQIRPDPRAPRAKRRAQPRFTGPAGDGHVIGAGMHVYPCAPPLPIVSLTLLTDRDGLRLNGIFDIDSVALVLDTRRPLMTQLTAPIVEDPHDGYVAWRARRPRVIHWEEVARCHARHGLRMARTLAGCGHDDIDEALVGEYHARRPAHAVDDVDEVSRDLVKTLAAESWREALHIARRLAVFAGEPAFAWLTTALAAWDGATAVAGSSIMARARGLLAVLGDAAQEPLARLAAAIPGVLPFPGEAGE
jgi:hypothetical protein